MASQTPITFGDLTETTPWENIAAAASSIKQTEEPKKQILIKHTWLIDIYVLGVWIVSRQDKMAN